MYVKNNKGLIAIIIILAILVIALGVYIFKRESIRQWVSKDVPKTTEENNTKYEEDVNKIITLGTGMKRPSQYKPSEQYYIIDNRKYELNTLVNSLKNEELKKEINTFIKESTDKLENKRSDFQQYIEEGNKEREKIERAGNKLDYYRVISTNGNLGDESDPIQIFTEWKCTNGYLSISLSYKYAYGELINRTSRKDSKIFNYGPYEIYCATYDLYTGKRIQFSDLFFEGEDYGAELYEFMKGKIATDIMEQYVKREFTTLPQDYQYFTIENIIFNKQNLYFSEATEISTAYYYTMFPTLTIGRDMKNIYSNDKLGLNKAMMDLYKKENVSPLSGCLPMLVQIPVFFSLYKVLAISIDMRQAPFFGYIKNLAEKDPTTIWNLFGLLPYHVNFLHIGLLPCLMSLTMWIQQKMTSASGGSSSNQDMQTATKIMPLIFLFLFSGMPAGLLIYWTFSNIISISQQYYIERKVIKK